MSENNREIISFVITATAVIFFLAVITILMIYLYQKRKSVYHANLNNLKLEFEKSILKTQIEIQEQTFQNISREIHDNISHSMTLAKLNLNTIDWLEVETAYNSVKSSIQLIGTAISDLSSLSKGMNPELIQNLGLIKAVKNECDKLQQIARLDVQYSIIGEPIFMDCEKELILFRIIQEAFNNIIKHANATRVWLQLDYREKEMDILIKDNGHGFIKEKGELEKVPTAGLLNMTTRARLFGGKFLIESNPEWGTQILITIPYQH